MKIVWALLALGFLIVGSIGVWKFDVSRPSRVSGNAPPQAVQPEGKVAAEFGNSPAFSLTERSGKTLSKEDLRGKPWIADFIFTSCAGQCPLMSLQMKALQKQFGPETGFRFVSFTVDPKRDTPEVLAKYAGRYEAEKDRWFFLTGPMEEMNRILKEFFLNAVETPDMHSVRFILVDGAGRIRGYYDSSDPNAMNQLVHDAKIL